MNYGALQTSMDATCVRESRTEPLTITDGISIEFSKTNLATFLLSVNKSNPGEESLAHRTIFYQIGREYV